ncbi:MAG TPA: dienelactone hydrolase family protein [Longimicrobiaceae bacterium]|nr:dienelactone hydrolase family protein [Longimicrobiaceae bacterium]
MSRNKHDRKRRILLGLLPLLALAPSLAPHLDAQAAPAYWGDLRPGPHAVGYRLDYVRDPSRTAGLPPLGDRRQAAPLRLGPEQERVFPLRIWYPAAAGTGGATVRYGEYLGTRPDSGTAPAVADSLHARTMDLVRFAARWYAAPTGAGRAPVAPGDTAGLAERLLASPAYAVRGPRPASGAFPVVVFAGGASHSEDENVVLWEYLASHGYVVAAFPSVGVGRADLPATAGGLETQARDMEAAIGYLDRVPFADRTRLAAMGFSFGGAAALVTAGRNAWVDAVVGMDASFIARRFDPVVRGAPLFSPGRMRAPLLEFHRADSTVSYAVVDSLGSATRYHVEFAGLFHIDFNSYALAYRAALRGRTLARATARDSALAVKGAAYRGMAVVTREFLDAYVKGENGAETRLRAMLAPGAPAWSGVPGDEVRFRSQPRAGGP